MIISKLRPASGFPSSHSCCRSVTRQKRTRAVAKSSKKANSANGDRKTSFFSNPLVWYGEKLETHPLTTKCISSGIISGSGDLLCQYLVHQNAEDDSKKEFKADLIRTGRFGILGFFLVAPVVHFWYGSLMARLPGASVTQVLKRTFLDQGFFAPIFLPTFMLNLMMLEGREAPEVIAKLKEDLPDALVTNWCLWIPAMLINFRFVPGKWQVLYSNMIGFVWNVYLSWKTQDASTFEAVVESRM